MNRAFCSTCALNSYIGRAVEPLRKDLFEEIPSEPDPRPVKVRSRQSLLGQYFTPESIALFMSRMFGKLPSDVRLLDAGAGGGALTVAFAKTAREVGYEGSLHVDAFEIDSNVLPELGTALRMIGGPRFAADVYAEDFVRRAAGWIKLGRGHRYTHCIMNPPYMKIGGGSEERHLLSAIGLETVNMYTGFVGLALDLLEEGGELVAIIPRSFCNGPYYQPFRRFVFERAAITHIHLFESRNKAFKTDGVLQENIIIQLKRGYPQRHVTVSTSTDGTFADYTQIANDFDKIVYPDDEQAFIHIPTGGQDELLASHAFCHKLEDLGLSVSTGPVVDFRLRAHMCEPSDPNAVPLIYSSHFLENEFVWPKLNFKKSNAIRRNATTEKWLVPSGFYCVTRRFSSKEERRRIVAYVLNPSKLPTSEVVGLENHLNLIHEKKRPLSEELARGLGAYLNATAVDRYFRRFNGHTQVNATDLRTMRFPSLEVLRSLGHWAKEHVNFTQEQIDAKVASLA